MTFLERTARRYIVIKAARQIREEIEKAGLTNLQTLVEAGQSIVTIYLEGCSREDRARIKRDLNALLQMSVTPDMILDEVARQMPRLLPIMEGKDNYRRSEVEKLMSFLKEG